MAFILDIWNLWTIFDVEVLRFENVSNKFGNFSPKYSDFFFITPINNVPESENQHLVTEQTDIRHSNG